MHLAVVYAKRFVSRSRNICAVKSIELGRDWRCVRVKGEERGGGGEVLEGEERRVKDRVR